MANVNNSNNYHLYNISVQFYTVFCTDIIVNRSSSVATPRNRPENVLLKRWTGKPAVPTCVGR